MFLSFQRIQARPDWGAEEQWGRLLQHERPVQRSPIGYGTLEPCRNFQWLPHDVGLSLPAPSLPPIEYSDMLATLVQGRP